MDAAENSHKRSLTASLVLSVLTTVSAVFVLYGVYTFKSQYDQQLIELKGQAEESATRLGRTLAPDMEAFQINEYEKLTAAEVQTENHYGLAAIIVEDYVTGVLLGQDAYVTGYVRNDSGVAERFDADQAEHRDRVNSGAAEATQEIRGSANELIGRVRVYVDDRLIKETIPPLVVNVLFTLAMLLGGLSLLLIWILKHRLIQPLNNLAHALEDRDADGIPTSVMPNNPYQELATVSDTINEMLYLVSDSRDRLKTEHQHLENVIRGTRSGVWHWLIKEQTTKFNERWAEIVGYTAEELNEMSEPMLADLIHPADVQAVRHRVSDHLAGRIDYYHSEHRILHKEGHYVWVLMRGQVSLRSPGGTAIEMFGTCQDISQRRQHEQQIELAASIYTQLHEGILITDDQSRIIDVNAAFTRITGYERREVIGKSPNLLKSGRQGPEFYDALWEALKRDGFWSGELWNKRKNGEIYPQLASINTVKSRNSDTEYYVALFSDITALKEQEYKLERIAHYDTLTGLPNRVLMRQTLRQTMREAVDRKQTLGLLFLDLDGFKEVNDQHGHQVGDRLLQELAVRVPAVLRPTDTVARLGGDEFIILLPDISQEALKTILNRTLKVVSDPVLVNGQSLQVSSSIGIALYPEHGDVDADQLLRHADQAMYTAKLAGKNCFKFFDANLDETTRGLHHNIAEIEKGIEADQFEMYYQPKVHLVSGEVLGFEALIRWNHQSQGLLLPGDFLPFVENHELMVRIGEWTIHEALKQLRLWAREGINGSISVNLSAIHLQQQSFVRDLHNILSGYPDSLRPKLEFEVLETSALENIDQVAGIIEECKNLGIRVAIDDFGTGYSTLAYLKQIPAQILKIDQSFVRNLQSDSEDLYILEAIVGLANAFKHEVIAEGLESMDAAPLLIELGCKAAQGYGIARPMPASEIPQWIASWRHNRSETPLH